MKLSTQIVAELSGMDVISVQNEVRRGHLPSLDTESVREWLYEKNKVRARQELLDELNGEGKLTSRTRLRPNWR